MQKWIIYACIILIVNSIFHILTPNNSLKETMSFVLNLFLIGLILMPIFKNISTPKITQYFKSDLNNFGDEQQFKQNIFNLNKKSLEQALILLLENNGFKNCNLVLESNGNTNKTKILIKIPSNLKNNELKIKNLIKTQTGIVPDVVSS